VRASGLGRKGLEEGERKERIIKGASWEGTHPDFYLL